jgi:3'-phosphoadenosine 5'-phosphosulfate sulfotransferase (PAPS reductase)/FAD synthetase
MIMPTSDELRMLQALPLELKVARTKQRIREWVDYWGKEYVYVSFSGGKDSTVLLHIVRQMYGDEIPAVFVNTGLEFPEIQHHVRSFPNVVILHPEMNFRDVLTKYGYPVISKEVSQCIYETRKFYSNFVNVERERERDESELPRQLRKLLGVGQYAPRERSRCSAQNAESDGSGGLRDPDGGEYP